MFCKALNTIKKHGMLSHGRTVVAGVSGGIDSMAMLHVLMRLQGRYGLKIRVCHLNHNLRAGESRRDHDFVRDFCGKNGLEFAGRTLRKGSLKNLEISLQEAAREKRLAFFHEIAFKAGASAIALGHTLDDQAETVLMRLIKGSSLNGLSGMSATRGKLIRPLIDVSRAEIERYAKENKVPHVVDSSNLKPDYLRNRLRLRLIPYIKRNFNPNIIPTIARTACSLKRDDDFLEGISEEALKNAVILRERDSVVLSRASIEKTHDAVKARVFLKALRGFFDYAGDDGFSSAHVSAFLNLLSGKSPDAELDIAHGIKVKREYEKIILSRGLSRHKPKSPEYFEAYLKIPGITTVKSAGFAFISRIQKTMPKDLGKDKDRAYFDYDKLVFPVLARSFKHGDRIAPLGMKGHKKVKEIFIEGKIPAGRRRRIPMLVSGNEVMCIAGIKESEIFKLTENTKRILRIEWKRQGGPDAL